MSTKGSRLQRAVDYFREASLDEARVAATLVDEVMAKRLAEAGKSKAGQTKALQTRKPRTRKPKATGADAPPTAAEMSSAASAASA